MQLKLTLSYNGAKFCGSQTQPNGRGVEDALNEALKKLGIFDAVASAGRTDKGVGAFGQVCAVKANECWRGRLDALQAELNSHIQKLHAHSLIVRKVEEAVADFQPRFDAKARLYRYFLCHDKPNIFLSDFAYFTPKPNLKLLNEALSAFVGRRDFSEFCKKGGWEKGYEREVFAAYAYSFRNHGGEFSVVCFKANAFLRSQVRLMLANALAAAKSEDLTRELRKNFKPLTRIPAPSNGLFLARVFY